ncbi:hypothetical protein D7V94_02690 [Parablautia intestinalis]|jgi:tRNA(Ile2) C34 agmatinyltransferase TiaS|uniref:Uncharacterized protein n=1 Tax=Parablautia intestinalis TaxID=2320100 RepID=A0A3A9B2C6_9FIRM|nr:hypothetical protein [Parablautia intestinalis]MCI8616220.1 hypothetical protein [Lachnospiraceae bacterium]RKI93616.1 hypothetical protein D7V94_02690 [Parablautia intestinalis]
MAEKMKKPLLLKEVERPTFCTKCSGVMVYKGLGEYRCEDCGEVEYDDYGKVRKYLEVHKGANVSEISGETGVSHKSIRDMIKEKRFEVVENRGGYLRCEICGANIRSGRFCPICEEAYHRRLEEEMRGERKNNLVGYGENMQTEKGSKRFTRER